MIEIDNKAKIPKYKQIIREVKNNLQQGDYVQGDKLPSINKLKDKLSVARDTVIKAYKELVNMGIITSRPGKGYYISRGGPDIEHNIFLLFDSFTSYKEIVYNSFRDNVGRNSNVDIYFHNYDIKDYKKLIQEAIGNYTDYVIIPLENGKSQKEWFDRHMSELNTYILDLGLDNYGKEYPSVCQNFEKQWYLGLSKLKDKIKMYNKLELINYRSRNGNRRDVTEKIISGFKRFTTDYNINSEIINSKEDLNIELDKCFAIPQDKDLIFVVKSARQKNIAIQNDLGIISHKEKPLKSMVCNNGVTTISTSYEKLGECMAEMVRKGEDSHIISNSQLILRQSL